MTDDCKKWLEEQENEFMVPQAVEFTADEAAEFDGEGEGWYSRLSAPGYLDCTDWGGPYDSEEAALEALYDDYGD